MLLARALQCLLVAAGVFAGLVSATGQTYTNPIVNVDSADPWMFCDNDWYYLVYTNSNNVTLYRSRTMAGFAHAEGKALFVPQKGTAWSTELWAPEIHRIDGKWYIIVSADPNNSSPSPLLDMMCTFSCPAVNHRMYVLESSGPDVWDSTYELKAKPLNLYDQFAIDATYFKHDTGLYLVYSCWYDKYISWPSNLCIVKMKNAWTVESSWEERQIISVPSNPWEKTPYGRSINERLSSNEGPQQLVSRETGQHFIIYSAARSDNPDYCLGQLALRQGGHPMEPGDWTKKNDGCIFYQNKEAHVYGPGHASFVRSPDGTEDWIVYHAMTDPYTGWTSRNVRIQKYTWNQDGTPNFPRPGLGPYPVPSGQQ